MAETRRRWRLSVAAAYNPAPMQRSVLTATFTALQEAQGGSNEARSLLLERLRGRLVLWATARLSDALRARHDPEDVAQEILLALHRDLEQFRGEDDRSFKAWVFRVAENRIRDLAQRESAQKRQLPEPREVEQTSPSQAAIRIESADRLRRAVGKLPDDHRRVIQLRRFEERETVDVAQLMGRTENAVRVLYFRAVKGLRAAMDEMGEIENE